MPMNTKTSRTGSFRHNHNEASRQASHSSSVAMNINENGTSTNTTSYQMNKMSISQMRALHAQALREAEAKQTELRLVLSSRYKELVGSSDEVLAMKDMAEELYATMEVLPESMKALMTVSEDISRAPTIKKNRSRSNFMEESKHDESDKGITVDIVKHQISSLPRILFRALDKENPHTAAIALVRLFAFMKSRMNPASKTNKYPLVQILGSNAYEYNSQTMPVQRMQTENVDPRELLLLDTQIRMIYLHVQTIPLRIIKLAKKILLRKADTTVDSSMGALSALALLDVKVNANQNSTEQTSESQSLLASRLLDTYFDSKAKLLHRLLDELISTSAAANQHDSLVNRSSLASSIAARCEKIMSDIVTVIQFDVILHSHEMFCRSSLYPTHPSSLPEFDPQSVKQKCSHFLASHIPLLRSQIRNVLVSSVSVDASMLGEIRQSLYDITTNPANISDNLWEEAVDSVIDGRLVSPATYGASNATTSPLTSGASELTQSQDESTVTTSSATQKFSLWSALFSTTFSSLVHDLLSSSFHSVHSSTISTLLQSLSRAPRRFSNIPTNSKYLRPSGYSAANLLLRPHEANRNTLLIASQLDRSLQKLSDDAHHLLVHAEEREESERRLRQSLYVQTCEIMGRLLSEIRRMIMKVELDDDEDREDDEIDDATKEMIVGRLCHLIQSRPLSSLKILLDPRNAPASTSISSSSIGTSGVLELGSGSNINTHGISSRSSDTARGMITLDELQSAFEIADDDDDGVISFTEAVEAMGGAFSGTPFNGAEMVRSTLLITDSSGTSSDTRKAGSTEDGESRTLQNVTLFELGLLSAKGLRHDTEGSASAMGLIQSCLETIVQRCFRNWAKIVLSPLHSSLKVALDDQWEKGKNISNVEWLRVHQQEYTDGTMSAPSSISAHVLSYLLSVSCEMNSAVCPADSIPSGTLSQVSSLVEIVRKALLKQSAEHFSNVFESRIITYDEADNQIGNLNRLCMSQILGDVRFIQYCFFDDKNEFDEDDEAKEKLDEVERILNNHCDDGSEKKEENSNVAAIELSRLFLNNLFGKHHHALGTNANIHAHDTSLSSRNSSNSHILLLNPVESSRRFVLLPIQSEKQITDLELRSNYANKSEETETENEPKPDTSGVGSTGFGFFSSMLKKK